MMLSTSVLLSLIVEVLTVVLFDCRVRVNDGDMVFVRGDRRPMVTAY